MSAIATWLKQVGGALFACLVLFLAVVPTVDALVCASDAPVAESLLAQAGDQVVATADTHGGEAHRDTGGDACVHGHCHQATTPAVPANIELAEADVSGADLIPAEAGLPPSRAPDGLMEPPRA